MLLPTHLRSGKAEGLIPGEIIAQYELGSMRNFIYLVLDAASKTAAIVDPQRDLRPLDDLKAHGYRLTAIILTHSHHDHVVGVTPLLALDPTLPIYMHDADTYRLKNVPRENLRLLADGERFRVGAIELEAIHSPGHSPGEICYRISPPGAATGFLLTGDTLFIRDCGRTDLDRGSDSDMFRTLQRLKALPDSLIVLPGHHYAAETASWLGTEKKMSPPLLCESADELANLP